MRAFRRMNRPFVLLSAALVVVACGTALEESPSMDPETLDFRHVCIGRHVVELPEAFDLSGHELTLYYLEDDGNNHRTVDIVVRERNSDEDRFRSIVEDRASEVSSAFNFSRNAPMLVSAAWVGDREALLTSFASPDVDTALDSELHVLVENHHVMLRARSFDGQTGAVVQELRNIAGRMSAIPLTDAARSGFCLGPILLQGDHDHEVAELAYHDRRSANQDLRIEITINSFQTYTESERLLSRTARGLGFLGITGATELRAGSARLASQPAEEMLLRLRSGGHVGHAFSIEGYPEVASITSPMIRLEMHSGKIMDETDDRSSSLSDNQATTLWDRIRSSLKERS